MSLITKRTRAHVSRQPVRRRSRNRQMADSGRTEREHFLAWSNGASRSVKNVDPVDEVDESPVLPWKRASDLLWIMLALPGVLLLALAVYCWIKGVSRGPVLYRQTRIGRGGKPFTIYKFRSMKPDAPTDLHQQHVRQLISSGQPMTKLDLLGDPRLIKGGCVLRMAGLDELPQLLNVLRGEMSLIGPRPCVPDEFEFHGADRRRRFSVQPGLTGLWQVSRTQSTTFPAMLEMDEEYVERMSLWLDLKILARTPLVLFRQIKTCTRHQADSSAKAFERKACSTPEHGFVRPMSANRRPID